MNIPADYTQGYETARAVAPDIADKYVAHTLIGDPTGKAMMDDLSEGVSKGGSLWPPLP